MSLSPASSWLWSFAWVLVAIQWNLPGAGLLRPIVLFSPLFYEFSRNFNQGFKHVLSRQSTYFKPEWRMQPLCKPLELCCIYYPTLRAITFVAHQTNERIRPALLCEHLLQPVRLDVPKGFFVGNIAHEDYTVSDVQESRHDDAVGTHGIPDYELHNIVVNGYKPKCRRWYFSL